MKLQKNGAKIIYTTRVIGTKVSNEKIEEIVCLKTKVEDGKAIDIPNSEHTIKVDNLIFAIGLVPDKDLINKLGIKNDDGFVIVDENMMTNIDGVFAGGDLTESKSTVCRSIKAGKTAAEKIEEYIKKVEM